MHGGAIEARSDGPGRGSEFIVRLPLSKAAAAAERTPSPGHRRVCAAGRSSSTTTATPPTTMAMFVEELGGTAFTAHDGASGLAAVETFQPDIVFMDIGMPGLDGYEVCRRIRQMPAHGTSSWWR